MPVDLAHVLDEGYLGDLTARPIEAVRAMRSECDELETGLSMLRRVVQGRLDIVGLELRRRREGGRPGDLAALIEQLPEVLAGRSRSDGPGRLPARFTPAEPDAALQAEVDGIADDSAMRSLPDLDDERLEALAESLAELERRVSAQRHELHHRIDALQAELVRRYRSGEASVEELLPRSG